MNFQSLINEPGNSGFLICEHGGQSNIAFEVADLDDHLVALLGHLHLVHFNVRQREAQNILVSCTLEFLHGAAMEYLCGVLSAENSLSQFAQPCQADNLIGIVWYLQDRQWCEGLV